MLAAKSVAYSDSTSGAYVSGTLFDKLGVAAEMKGKAHKIPGIPVAEIVAKGQADIGFQEVAEILSVAGADFVGKLPDALELLTPFATAVAAQSRNPAQAEALVRFISSPSIVPTLEKDGLEPPRR